MTQEKTIEIKISDVLRKILDEIKDDSTVASLLLKGFYTKEELVDNPINYISISSEDKTKISYLTKERIDIINADCVRLQGLDTVERSYWSSSRRFQARPGSFLSKLFKNILPKDIEKFSNLFKSIADRPSFTFEIVKGEGIRKNYHYKFYSSDRGSLGGSCMKHEECQKYLDIYTDNKDIVSMLVMKNDDGQVMGRALLWDFDSHKIMDRIYTTNDESFCFYFKQWAIKNNYLHKTEQNWTNTLSFSQMDGQKKQELTLGIKLDCDFSYYPYMDTFKFIDINSGMIYNHIPDNVQIKTLCSGDGSKYEADFLKLDDIDRIFRVRSECVLISYKNLNTWCNNAQWSGVNDQYILNGDHEYDQVVGDYIFKEEFDHLNNKSKIEEIKKFREERNSRILAKKIADAGNITTSSISNFDRAQNNGSQYRPEEYVASGVSFRDESEDYDFGCEPPVPHNVQVESRPQIDTGQYNDL